MNEENIQGKNQVIETAQTGSGCRSLIIGMLVFLIILGLVTMVVLGSSLGKKIEIPKGWDSLPLIFIFLIVPISWFFYKWSSEETRKKNKKMYELLYKTIKVSTIILALFVIISIVNFNQSW